MRKQGHRRNAGSPEGAHLQRAGSDAVGFNATGATVGRSDQTVFVVDDDEQVRQSMRFLLESVGRHVESFDSAESFLQGYTAERPGCLILDLRMPGMGGARLMERLVESGDPLPVIFLSAHGDVPLAVRVIKAGAIDFLQKPCNHEQLLETVNRALEVDGRRRVVRSRHAQVSGRLSTLTAREREILDMVVDGRSNKIIARALGISPKTVETHRGRVMLKMGVGSVAELVRTVMDRAPAAEMAG